jgi:glycosyltransferase involved in cell wall biosynthesis
VTDNKDSAVQNTHDRSPIGVVVIGRNEGERLKRCLASLPANATTIYVDSGSTDGSVAWARGLGIDVVELDTAIGFTAGRARNAGFRRLASLNPTLRYVQFVDGDCELAVDWLSQASAALDQDARLCAVFGRLRERFARASVYNLLCDIEWDAPVGPAKAFGGNALIRAEAFAQAHGFLDTLVAGEEPELALRLRQNGWSIRRLDAEMGLHDAALLRFGQWWRRARRGGYAYAQGAFLHGSPPERHWVWERNRALIWGIAIPLCVIAVSATLWPWGLVVWAIYPMQIVRLYLRSKLAPDRRMAWALFQSLTRFPEASGVMRFGWNRLTGRQARVMDKHPAG